MFHLIYRNQGEVYAVKTANSVTTTLLDQKGYDPRGRLIREWHSINGGTPVLVSSITYDEIERMNSNALGNSLVTTAFTYDIQNRLRKINDPANLGTKPFALELQYNSPDVTGATAQYAGNISAARWIQQGASGQTYYYSYDSYSRMTGGIHGGGNNEQSIGYDSNGNINALTRTGTQAAGLSYTYSGNRLTSLTKDGTPYSYAYDSNGNTTTDGLRGMSIAYNYLNLPKTVTKGSDVLTYIYDAAGNKLAEKINTTVNNFYTGAIVYKGDKTIDYIQTPTGIVRKVGTDFIRQYNINDHLGNVRAVVNQSGTIEQANDYYPYGLAFSYNNLDKNRYLYNGKEIQNQTLAATFFGVYDYGARYYDPVIGRWNTVDPMAEKYYSFSSFVYCIGNPVRFIDSEGRAVWIPLIIAGKAAVGAGIDITAQITVNMTVGGQSFGSALKSVDWTSVGKSAVAGALTAPGMSTAAKLFTAGVSILDASTDISINNGVKSIVTGDKSVAAATSDLAFSAFGSEASNRIVGSMKSAISSDLTSGTFKTLTKAEQNLLKQTSNVVNSRATQDFVSTVTNTFAGSINALVKGSVNKTSTPVLIPFQSPKPKILEDIIRSGSK